MSDRRSRVVRSGAYAFVASLFVRVIAIVRAVVFARLLIPSEVGRFALAAGAMATIDALTDTSLRYALVQRPNVTLRAAQTMWTALIVRGAVLTGAGVALAPTAATLLHAPSTIGLMRLVAFVPLLSALQSPAGWLRARDVDLTPQVRLEFAAATAELLLTVGLILATHSAWGLAGATVLGGCFRVFCSHLIAGFRPAIRFDRRELLDYLSFGGWISVTTACWFAATNADDLIVGRIAGTGPLGLYRLAFRIGHLPVTEVSETIQKVLFPTLSRMLEAGDDGGDAMFARSLMVASGLSAVILAITVPLAHDLVLGLLGPRWLGAVGPLRVLAVAGFIRAVTGPAVALFMAAGRPRLNAGATALSAIVLIVGVALVVGPFGITGASAMVVAAVAVPLPLWGAALHSVGLSPWLCLRIILERAPAALVAGAAAGAVVLAIPSPTVAAVAGLAVGGAAWLLAVSILDRPFWGELRGIFGAMRGARQRNPVDQGAVDRD